MHNYRCLLRLDILFVDMIVAFSLGEFVPSPFLVSPPFIISLVCRLIRVYIQDFLYESNENHVVILHMYLMFVILLLSIVTVS